MLDLLNVLLQRNLGGRGPQGLRQLKIVCAGDGCPQPEAHAPAGHSELTSSPGKRVGCQLNPRELSKRNVLSGWVLSAAGGSPNASLSFPRSAPTGWAQLLVGPACRLCPRRPTDRRRHSATRPPPRLQPPTSSRPTSRHPTRSRHCPTARRPTPPPPFPTWPATRTAAWRLWHNRSPHRLPGPRPALPPAPTMSRPAYWHRPPALWA